MKYYFTKTVTGSLEEAERKVTEALKEEGFGILTEIDIKATLKIKLDAEFRPYKILGACNPPFAHKALQAEDKIGLMLPCNVVVQEIETGKTEVSAVDPIAAMSMVDNAQLKGIAEAVSGKLKKVVENL